MPIPAAPTLIVAETIKGKGVSFAENTAAYHNGIMTQEQYDKALEQYEAVRKLLMLQGLSRPRRIESQMSYPHAAGAVRSARAS